MDSQSNSETRDLLCIAIERKIDDCPSGLPLDCHIFRVPRSLRKVNEEAYGPKLVAIGPYHHANAELQGMEVYKKKCLKRLLDRRGEPNADRYIIALKNKEAEARRFYADQESFSLDIVEFVKMLLLDGCFIIELFREFGKSVEGQTHHSNPIFQRFATRIDLFRDLLLLENQLPFSVLVELFEMSTLLNSPNSENSVTVLARDVLNFLLPGPPPINSDTEGNNTVNDIKHLLQLVHDSFCSPFDQKFSQEQHQRQANVSDPEGNIAVNHIKHLLKRVQDSFCFPFHQKLSQEHDREQAKVDGKRLLNCAVELEEAGIEFKMSDAKSSIFDIQFNKGVLKIPCLLVDDYTEILLRNLVVYEQYRDDMHPTYVSHYTYFLSRLINSTKDVQLLRRRGIIQNDLGSDAAIFSFLNKLGDGVGISNCFSPYSQVFSSVNQHCRLRRNLWMAMLRRYHLKSPWAIISVLAASMLLLLTFAQTLYTILAYYKGGHISQSN